MQDDITSLYRTMVRRLAATVGNGVVVRRSRLRNAGMGLFAQRRFSRGELITGYEGNLVSHIQARTLQRNGKHSHVRTLRWKDLAVDGLKLRPAPRGSGGASYANDGRQTHANNASYVIRYVVDGVLPVCFLRAKRQIESGEEILVSYGRTYCRVTPH
jgi:hypothetical protein